MKDESFTWGDVVRFWESVPQEFQIIFVVCALVIFVSILAKD